MIIGLNKENFEENIKSGLKLVEFYASWCGYCKQQRPILEELSNNNIWIGTIDADESPEIVDKYGIDGFPSFLLFKDGKVISSLPGYHNKSQLLAGIMKNLGWQHSKLRFIIKKKRNL